MYAYIAPFTHRHHDLQAHALILLPRDATRGDATVYRLSVCLSLR